MLGRYMLKDGSARVHFFGGIPGANPFSPAGGGKDFVGGVAASVEAPLAEGSGALARLLSNFWSLAMIVALFPALLGGEKR